MLIQINVIFHIEFDDRIEENEINQSFFFLADR